MLEHIAQCVATVAQLKWTESTEAFINEISENNNENALWDWLEGNKIQLMQLTDLINGGLTGIKHRSIIALITQDVHARDIIEELAIK